MFSFNMIIYHQNEEIALRYEYTMFIGYKVFDCLSQTPLMCKNELKYMKNNCVSLNQ